MDTIAQVEGAIRALLLEAAAALARPSGLVKRASKLTGPLFVQTLVLGWLDQPDASLEQLCQVAASRGVSISPQGLEQRFSADAAEFMREILKAAVGQMIRVTSTKATALLDRFSGVVLQDSSIINLPAVLADEWRGCGDKSGGHQAGLKVEVRLDALTGRLLGPLVESARTQDKTSAISQAPLEPGALGLEDLGYFSLAHLKAMAQGGGYFLCRLQAQTAIYDESGKRLELVPLLEQRGERPLDHRVLLGGQHKLAVRLLAVRVPQAVADKRRMRLQDEARRRQQPLTQQRRALAGWTVLITNVEPDRLSLEEALVLARVRWQIELLFKLWKQHGKIDEWRSRKPWRILCELYAKLTAMVLQHWLILCTDWAYPGRSLVKAAATVRQCAIMLAYCLDDTTRLAQLIGHIARVIASGCRMNTRRKHPNTYQLLLDPSLAALA